jgi:CubicO group peptidase (beta-lactamase class C family)
MAFKSIKQIFLVFLLALVIENAASQDSNLIPKLDSITEAYKSVYGFSGSIKVVVGNENLFEKSVGLADRSFGIPNTSETRFSINSISKTFTAAAILSLVADGEIDLRAPVSIYIPELNAPWADSVTTHHLLTHTSGLPRESGIRPYDELNFKDQVKLVSDLSLLFTPGDRYEYSNCGFILLGAIIENTSGVSYENFVTERIITPLQLNQTGYYRGRRVVTQLAVPYRISANGLETAQRSKHFGDNAGGGLYSTPSDLYKFVTGLEENKLLSSNYVEMMFTPHVQSGETDFEGYAWSIKYFGDEKLYFAAGSGYGTKSVLIRMPESGDFIAICSNWGNTPILQLLGDLYLTLRGQNVDLPSENALANPANYEKEIGTYSFNQEDLTTHLGAEGSILNLQEVEGRLFMNDELLAKKEGYLKLTYTDEVKIRFVGDKMIIEINDNILEGAKLNSSRSKEK